MSLCISRLTHINVFVVTSRVSMHTPGLKHMNVFSVDESCLYAYVMSHMNLSWRRVIILCVSHLTQLNMFVVTSRVFMHEVFSAYECVCGDESCLCMSHVTYMNVFVATSHVYA